MDDREKQVLEELVKRGIALNAKSIGNPTEWLRKRTFPKQFAFITSPARWGVAYCSRQAGKTKGIVYALGCEAASYKNVNGEAAMFGYVSLTKQNAVKLIWVDLMQVIEEEQWEEKGIVTHIDRSLKTVTFHNKNTIEIFGMKDLGDIEKIRGRRIRRIYFDEIQSARDENMEYCMSDVIPMSLIANNGGVRISGTPSAMCAGYFFDACHAPESYDIHNWTIFDNTFLIKSLTQQGTTLEQFLADTYNRKGKGEGSAEYKREAQGLWIKDDNFAMYKFKDSINTHDFPQYDQEYILKNAILDPDDPKKRIDFMIKSKRTHLPKDREWFYVLGIDFGNVDDCAWVVLAFSKEENCLYVVETINHSGMIPSVAADLTNQLFDHYQFYKIMGDTGGLGKGYAEEFNIRHPNTKINPAQKTDKNGYIKLMNDDMVQGRIKVAPKSALAQDWQKLVWKVVGIKEKDGQDNHLADACLYAWRECYSHSLYEPAVPKHKPGSPEWAAQKAQELEEFHEEQFNKKDKEWWE